MIFIDAPQDYPGHQGWCHLWGENIGDLHSFAARLGLRREWFQDRASFPHYDLSPQMRLRAIERGACVTSLRHFLKMRAKATGG